MDNYGAERQAEGKGDKRGERESWKQRTIEGAYRPRGSGGGMASQVSFPPSGWQMKTNTLQGDQGDLCWATQSHILRGTQRPTGAQPCKGVVYKQEHLQTQRKPSWRMCQNEWQKVKNRCEGNHPHFHWRQLWTFHPAEWVESHPSLKKNRSVFRVSFPNCDALFRISRLTSQSCLGFVQP